MNNADLLGNKANIVVLYSVCEWFSEAVMKIKTSLAF